ncbi:hypothetical protein [Cetobacterium sp.]|uniref:hypothetical protein n=1 Tax=Cetobacterium sp. TaxID=2071632 RepID=UPI003F2D72A2
MSLPNIPNINPDIDLEMEDSIKLLLNSIAMEEIGLSHILNAEGEKLQCIIKKMESNLNDCVNYDPCNSKCDCDRVRSSEILLAFNNSVNETIKNVFRSQTLLQLKLEDVKELYKMIEENKKKKSKEEQTNRDCHKKYEVEKRYEEEKKYNDVWEKEKIEEREVRGREEEIEEVSCKPIYIYRN